ncbi:hypothetical protein [Carboxylicivirga caseinilyticus]|uniref:hypothetical protein n=1 Tax=Carboxylicivirga caseinilyticus TaxID=3417572 RepID=UPI003D35728A|nr:hypothetical protein [Marinilabiliaceae bacterium A049]
MKWKAINYFITLTALISWGFCLIQNSSSGMKQKLDAIFTSDRITIIIEHHGGYTASYLGKSTLLIRKVNNDTTYSVSYKDAIDRKKLAYTINTTELQELKDLVSELIDHHDPNKKLSGDCLTIDKNYQLQSPDESLTIKPAKNYCNSYCVINWIYQHDLQPKK